MTKEIKNYLPFYLGCECMVVNHFKSILLSVHENGNCQVAHAKSGQYFWDSQYIKPILRPLNDIREDEAEVLNCIYPMPKNYPLNGCKWTFDEIHFLIKNHFDIFDLIKSGLAIDTTTEPKNYVNHLSEIVGILSEEDVNGLP